MAIKKYDSPDDLSPEEHRANLQANAEARRKRQEEGLRASRERSEAKSAEDTEKSTSKKMTFPEEKAYRAQFERKNRKKAYKNEKVRQEMYDMEAKRIAKEVRERSNPADNEEKIDKIQRKIEKAQKKTALTEAREEKISAKESYRQAKKDAYCEKHPVMCRIKYGKQDKFDKDMLREPMDGKIFKEENKKESMVTVNINQGSGNYEIKKPASEPTTPVYEETPEPPIKTKRTFCEKHPKICRTGKKSKVNTAGSTPTSVAADDDVALDSFTSEYTRSTKPRTTRSAPKKPSTKKSAAKRTAPAKSPQVKKKSNTATKKTAPKSAPKKKSPPKKKSGDMWEYGGGGLFD